MGDPVTMAIQLGLGLASANQGKQSQMGAVGREKAMGTGLWNTKMEPYGKKASSGMWSLLDPELQAVLSGNTQVINPELTSGMYNYLTRDLTKNYNEARAGTSQGMVNRGMDYGNIMSKVLGDIDRDYRTTLGDIGTKTAWTAAQVNDEAQRQRYSQMLRALMGLFGQAKGRQYQLKDQGLGLLTDANSAQAAAQGNYWNAISGLLGGAMSGLGSGTGQFNVTNWLKSLGG